MTGIKIETDKCTGCKLCISACPFGAITIKNMKAEILNNCTLCGACSSSCKFDALQFENEKLQVDNDITEYKGVWVFAEQKNGIPVSVVLELLGQGRKLAEQLQVPLSAVLLGENVEDAAKTLITYGADVVYLVDSPVLKHYNDEAYTDVFIQIINKYKPEIILIGGTTYGRSLAPRISSRLNTGLTADCTGLEIDKDKRLLLQTRPAFGGNIMATIVCPNQRPQMSTVRPKVMKSLEPDASRVGEIIKTDVTIPSNVKTKVTKMVSAINEKINLLEADVIVSAGRGIEDPQNMKIIEELAEVLGGAVGASRAIVDSGWIGYNHQIGQTGKVVSPKIYFACGISGAIQHLAGMSSSDVIIAVNKNPDAPIFKIANFGIVGDVLEVVPLLVKEFKSRIS
ncbi:FAD-binding protein [Ruminiclostridium josui]|uniref:FAD-binding protein n=1 Tax=Ruminiclostridium josui TaxID=1499 RepID=UPI0004659688|nr:FAD-binding protein [Ruminiclostridium josui]